MSTVTSTGVQVSELEQRTLAKVTRYLMTYIIMGEIVYFLCRTNIGFAQLTMGKDLGLTAQAFGFAAGIFALGAFFMQVPTGLLFEKYGARKWMTFNMVAWGLVVISQGLVAKGAQLTILRFFLGVFEAGFVPGVNILVSIWFRGRSQGRATSGVQIGSAISGILSAPFGGWMLGQHFFHLAGWRNLFILEGAASVIFAFIALTILSDTPAKTRWLKPDEREFMAKYLAEYQADKVRHGALVTSGLWRVLKDSRVVMLILAWTCMGWTTSTFTFFTPTLLKTARSGLSNQYVGFLAMGIAVVQVVVSFTWGRHGDKTGGRHSHTVLPLLVTSAGMLLYPIAKGTPLLSMVSLMLVQAGNVAYFVNFWPSCNMVVGKDSIAKATVLIWTGTQLGGFVAPMFFGWAMDKTGSTNLGMYTGVAVVLVNFTIMNVFFLKYKAQQKALATANAEQGMGN